MMYNIIFHDGSSMEIDHEQRDKIIELKALGKKEMIVNDDYITFSSIARIKKANKNFEYPALPTINETITTFTPEKRKSAMRKMAEGFKKNFRGGEMPKHCQAMYNKFNQRIEKS